MLLAIYELIVPLAAFGNSDNGEKELLRAAARRLQIAVNEIALVKILHRVIDARSRHREICFVINAVVETKRAVNFSHLPKVKIYSEPTPLNFSKSNSSPLSSRPVIIGAGPAGLAAGFALALAGANPLIIERGATLENRQRAVGDFWGKGILHPENNVLFGEGGAGAFSDGKLTSRTKDLAAKNFILELLIACGAPSEILFDAYPHLGSDRLAKIIPRWREKIRQLGGEFLFHSRVTDLLIEQRILRGVKIADKVITTNYCLAATGHSADDFYELLADRGVNLQSKGYAVGVRVELPQSLIDAAQYHGNTLAQKIGAASFFLTHQGICHSFCMCPGGKVISGATREKRLFTNGMSLSERRGQFANAAFLLPRPATENFLTALNELNQIEEKSFLAGGGDYFLPATTLAKFPHAENDLPERSFNRSRAADFNNILPPEDITQLRECLPAMLKKIGGKNLAQIVIYGAETRSASPIRVVRNEIGESVNTSGLYPIGEGAGYAGGIISSAIDGIRAAEKILTLP